MRFAHGLPSSLLPAVLALASSTHAAPTAGAGSGSCDGRVPIQSVPGNASWRHVITEPGSYYLAADVVGGPNLAAIRVDVPNVTIDFNGFSLIGTDPGALNGLASSQDDVVLRGPGRIRDWTGGVFLGGARCRVEGLTVSDTLTNGIQLLGPDGVVERCVVTGNAREGIHLAAGADGATVRDCKLRNNLRHQVFVESDGCVVEGCSATADQGVTQPAVTLAGAANVLRDSIVLSGAVGEKAIDVPGVGNRVVANTVRIGPGATLGEGIGVTGTFNQVRGGTITVEASLGRGIRFDTPLDVVGTSVGLLASADGATAILGNAAGHIEQANLYVGPSDAFGVDFQGGAANVGATFTKGRIRVAGIGSTAIRSLASASIVQMGGIVLEPGATNGITVDFLGGPGGHHVWRNEMLLAGANQHPILNGTGDLFDDNDVLVLGDGSTAVRKVSGSAGMIRDNRIRLAGANATGIFVSEFLGELVSHNVVLGDGDHYDVGEGNAPAQILANPGNGFLAEDVANLQIGN